MGDKFYLKYKSKIIKNKIMTDIDDSLDKFYYFLVNFENFKIEYLQQDKEYFDILFKYKDISILFYSFFLKMIKTNKKNIMFDNEKIKLLLYKN